MSTYGEKSQESVQGVLVQEIPGARAVQVSFEDCSGGGTGADLLSILFAAS